ncbi:class I SAM-dependent methyltransferase [Paucidesulfovibrio longus]|uniref:class I SAM-dependent methyltransferase n=1 Tax=Paucidesulfovibrio longus TaxID=889 RepID=UPI0003B6BF07|nr:class I SAM-dependent methyltransferase [Paucidesulfovibrio longus]
MTTTNTSLPDLAALGGALLRSFDGELDENDRSFIERVYSGGAEVYADRLRAVGLDRCERVLDAGCGFGQWSLCLAALGPEVVGVDVSALRVRVANAALALAGKAGNAIRGNAVQGGLDALPAANGSVDGAFCYGTLFCTPWKASLTEFARVLRPGGRLYFTANGLGYVLNMWTSRPHRNADFDPREAAANTFRNTLEYEKNGTPPQGGQILIDPDDARAELDRLGLDVVALAPEGNINIRPGELSPRPFFQAEYHGLPGCYEVLAEKRSV